LCALSRRFANCNVRSVHCTLDSFLA
jgi:hypothetical protein